MDEPSNPGDLGLKQGQRIPRLSPTSHDQAVVCSSLRGKTNSPLQALKLLEALERLAITVLPLDTPLGRLGVGLAGGACSPEDTSDWPMSGSLKGFLEREVL